MSQSDPISAPGAIHGSETDAVEADFALGELFFSRTDGRGVIKAGNKVFQRVSAYDWDDLIGAPHKIIRHPDMPRGVFWLMWSKLKAGQAIGAYVKNRSGDGKFYWVYAIITPVENGYLSVRMKPTSDVFTLIKGEYAALRARETEEKLDPEASADLLLTRLAALGFPDYESFMAHAVRQESKARSQALHSMRDDRAFIFSTMTNALANVRRTGDDIVREFEAIRSTPLNMRIQAEQLGEQSAVLSVISMNYTTLSDEIFQRIRSFLDSSDTVLAKIRKGLFLTCVCRLQKELIDQFDGEVEEPGSGWSKTREVEYLQRQMASCRIEADRALRSIANAVEHFIFNCLCLKRILSGLNLTRVLSQIEVARIGGEAKRMSSIIGQLSAFQSKTQACLNLIESESHVIRQGVRQQIAETRSGSSLAS